MDIWSILTIIGVPTLISSFLAWLLTTLIHSYHHKANSDKCIKRGLQALLRAKMLDEWAKYSEKGYAPTWAKENFENCWQQYHSLGANGVMNNIHESFMELPLKKEVTHEERT